MRAGTYIPTWQLLLLPAYHPHVDPPLLRRIWRQPQVFPC